MVPAPTGNPTCRSMISPKLKEFAGIYIYIYQMNPYAISCRVYVYNITIYIEEQFEKSIVFVLSLKKLGSRPSRFKMEAMTRIKVSPPLKPMSSKTTALLIDSYRLGSCPAQSGKGSVAGNVISKKSNEVKTLKRLWLWRSRGTIMCGIGREHRDGVVDSATAIRNNGVMIKSRVSIQ